MGEEWVILRQRLWVGYVQCGAEEGVVVERGDEVLCRESQSETHIG
jgi:hypothetical protein